MFLNKCEICNKEKPDNKHYWREHKLSLEQYCVKYINRRDLYDGSLIEWKGDLETYFLTDYNSKANLKAHLTSIPAETAQTWCIEAFKKRKSAKGLRFVPSEVELRSLTLPPTRFLDQIFAPDGYYKVIGEKVGLENRFIKLEKGYKLRPINSQTTILVDSREQKPIKLPNLKVGALDYGDYCRENSPTVFFERKSLNDFVSTMSVGFERFQREIIRAQDDRAYIVVLIESHLNSVLSFDKLPLFKSCTKASSSFIFHRVRLLLQNYDNIQLLFLDNRNDLKDTLLLLANNQDFAKKHDLQYSKTIGII